METEVAMIVELIADYGFSVVMMVGLGYFVYFVWNFISEHMNRNRKDAFCTLVGVMDKTRMLDKT